MRVPFVTSLLIHASAATASAVGDFCSKDIPCEPSDNDSLFCDFQIGPTAGGYCVACEGRQIYFCARIDLVDSGSGRVDCEDKCSVKSCSEPCAEGQFCSNFNFQDGPCQLCETVITHPEECRTQFLYFPDAGMDACEKTCPPKSCSKRRHCLSNDGNIKYFCNFADESEDGEEVALGTCEPCAGLKSTDECSGRSSSDSGSQECAEVCDDVIVVSCDINDDCTKDRWFCNHNSSITENRTSSVCQACPISSLTHSGWHVNQCLEGGEMGLSGDSSQNCAVSCHTECTDIMQGLISVEGTVDIGKDNNIPMLGTPYASVSGPLVDCQLGGAGECAPDAPDDFVCLVSRGVRQFSDKVLNCEESGGIATIMYNNEESGEIVDGYVGDAPITIPITAISLQDGQDLLERALGLETKVEVRDLGDNCNRGCSDSFPCPSSPGSWYCDYKLDTHGYCQECGSDEHDQRMECFLSGLPLEGAQECADTCDSTLVSPSCKICGKGISGGSLQSAAEGGERCNFCPDGLKKSHFDREIPFIGKNATCYKLNQFFLNYPIAENDSNCRLALNFNYICDCEGPGYAGADSGAKKNVLIWLPRISGIISFLGSSTIIVDVVRDKKKRAKIYGQLMLAMSLFDLMGSFAYSLATLPIPKEYYIEGSNGSVETCTAQGFFIQMGTTSAFISVSLAVYYFCMITLSWTEYKMKKVRLWLFLCPIAVGLTLAFAGIPFYDMLFLWCNNSAQWWPELPIIIAIFVITCTMIAIFLDVYKTEKSTRQYRSHGPTRQSMSSVVFWQSVWYVFSFYITWLPYLALQYLWASGSFPPYGFVVFASTLVPLQGFWNCVVYFRIRAKKFIRETASRFSQSAPCLWFNAKKSNDIHGHESSATEFDAKGGDANVAKPYTTSKIQTPVTNVNSDAIGHETTNEKIDVS